MSEVFYGHKTVERYCIDCNRKFYSNLYDTGAIRCPECRIAKYREDDAKIMAELARRNRK